MAGNDLRPADDDLQQAIDAHRELTRFIEVLASRIAAEAEPQMRAQTETLQKAILLEILRLEAVIRSMQERTARGAAAE
jgi:hypothetical protein